MPLPLVEDGGYPEENSRLFGVDGLATWGAWDWGPGWLAAAASLDINVS